MRSTALRSHPHHKSKNISLCPRPCRFPGLCGVHTGFQCWLSFTLTEAEATCAGVTVEGSLPSAVRHCESPDVQHREPSTGLQKFTVLHHGHKGLLYRRFPPLVNIPTLALGGFIFICVPSD